MVWVHIEYQVIISGKKNSKTVGISDTAISEKPKRKTILLLLFFNIHLFKSIWYLLFLFGQIDSK